MKRFISKVHAALHMKLTTGEPIKSCWRLSSALVDLGYTLEEEVKRRYDRHQPQEGEAGED